MPSSAAPGSEPQFHAADFEFAQDLLEGQSGAWDRFAAEFLPAIRARLRGMGASAADADDASGVVLEKLWAERKLAAYSGKGPLAGFVRTMAANCWLELLRKRRREIPASSLGAPDSSEVLDRLARNANEGPPPELPLAGLLREALRHALAEADPEGLLILRLSVLQGIRQRDLCTAWGGVHEGTISVKKKRVMEQIRADTIRYVQAREPAWPVTWEELMEACGDGAEAILGPASE